jgi:hypothetical protein
VVAVAKLVKTCLVRASAWSTVAVELTVTRVGPTLVTRAFTVRPSTTTD